MDTIIEIENLTKAFQNKIVLDHISVSFTKGGIYGLVGRNGAGKTMLLKCICGFVIPDSGSVTINGKRIGRDCEVPDNIGIIIENPGFLPNYDGYHNLSFLASVKRRIEKKEIYDAIRLVGLDPQDKKHVGKYSLGMRQRLGLAQAVMENPEILLLDEPMNGLDNSGVEEIRRLLLSLKEKGKTILLASHSKEDIQLLCDEVYEMDHGRILNRTSLRECFPKQINENAKN